MCRLRNIALESVTEKCDGRTDDGQSDPYVSLCFAGDTINRAYKTKDTCFKTVLPSLFSIAKKYKG